ncbi:hypothetical protein NE237_016122 [Protea cynaroides]|uniref:Uncharacterized protein n=1 Tax=Protea cynaroides TaxID=273540 RepID=A0A9Q0KFJ4_9MAGN|nr:hypothetical protein NE237_016122 [Protea cynaroides]
MVLHWEELKTLQKMETPNFMTTLQGTTTALVTAVMADPTRGGKEIRMAGAVPTLLTSKPSQNNYTFPIFPSRTKPLELCLISFSVCVQIPIIFLSAIFIAGRRPLIIIFIGCFITGIAFFLKDYELLLEWIPMLAVARVQIYIGSFAIGMGSVPWVMMTEIYSQ